ncbi:16S rRNA (guanine(527)-N(7))-methyltransferase RsmG [Chengkuizengella axinellae]|uniref:Ribosomal RNA small subunit methyltransferase G n=1 Tax=Chengkuizengella axinellae TaxID=3064388 RepID=A0ABT9J549_9BACL|nr:16S rRNA (guanine(527)-N(7))-methyltransferase RsmG [Chengkuizengella sp. 2205SS18-9]MDP5276074.1 16S rRNA (guanine(527)-N(7))-methyltransferase RsmG [Chengkuizengella sp. 2205SS18-9]
MNYEHFSLLLNNKSIKISSIQWEMLEIYFETLVEWNKKMNLTAITDKEQVFIKHFYDSISLSFYQSISDIESIADIGSGAGFPSIPLKIMFPHLKVTIIDSLKKRIHFLEHLTNELKLSNVSCVHGRAEELGRKPQYRDQFDLVTARAVARLNVLNEYCLPFVKKSGFFVAMKGVNPTDEVNEAKYSLIELKGSLSNVVSCQLPDLSDRNFIFIQKTDHTPKKYPRKAGTPLKKPLF